MNARAGVGIFVACLIVYHVNGRPHAEIDCVPAPYTAWSLIRHGSLDVSRYPELRPFVENRSLWEMPDGRWITIRPIGSVLIAIPFIAPIAAFRAEPFSGSAMLHLGKFVAACCVAGATILMGSLVHRLAPTAVWPTTLLFAFGTCLWVVASQALWMHGPATLAVCLGLWLLLPPEEIELGSGRALLAGLALGFAVLCRPTTALFGAATGLTFLCERRWRAVIGFGAGLAVPMLVLAFMNNHLFGHPFLGGYARDNWSERTPLWLGLSGLILAPSRGLFIYSPAFLVALVGLVKVVQRATPERSLLIAWFMAALSTFVFYGRWYDWRGGWCFGPRYLCELMPVLCLLFAVGHAVLGTTARRISLTLVGLSIAIHLIGVVGYSAHAPWHTRHPVGDHANMFTLLDTEIEAHARATARKVLGRR